MKQEGSLYSIAKRAASMTTIANRRSNSACVFVSRWQKSADSYFKGRRTNVTYIIVKQSSTSQRHCRLLPLNHRVTMRLFTLWFAANKLNCYGEPSGDKIGREIFPCRLNLYPAKLHSRAVGRHCSSKEVTLLAVTCRELLFT